MADTLAVLTVGLQYAIIVSMIDFYFETIPLGIAVVIFGVLSGIGIAIWHKMKSWQTVKQWRKRIVISLILGVGFFATDVLLAYLHGQINPLHFAGGILALPLTLAICPGFTMICVAGLVRAFYISQSAGASQQED